MVFYESPYKLIKTLNDFKSSFGDNRVISVSKEISKIHETVFRGSINNVLLELEEAKIKGEYVIVVNGIK